MPKVAPLDDENTYYKYAYEARQRVDKLAAERAARQKEAKGLSGKAGVMGDVLAFGGPNRKDPSQERDFKAGDAAYDATENIRESMQEDALKQESMALRKINQLNGNSARAAKEQARWEARQLKKTK